MGNRSKKSLSKLLSMSFSKKVKKKRVNYSEKSCIKNHSNFFELILIQCTTLVLHPVKNHAPISIHFLDELWQGLESSLEHNFRRGLRVVCPLHLRNTQEVSNFNRNLLFYTFTKIRFGLPQVLWVIRSSAIGEKCESINQGTVMSVPKIHHQHTFDTNHSSILQKMHNGQCYHCTH